MRRNLTVIALLIAMSAALGTVACGPTKADSPADAVQGLLSLREKGVTDAKAYRLYLPTDELASALASDSATRKRGDEPTPPWSDPKAYNETSRTADVKVVWQRSKEDSGWPEATVFSVEFQKGAWVVVDAVDVKADAIPKPEPRMAAPSTPASKPANMPAPKTQPKP